MKIGIDIRNLGQKRTGDEIVFFNLTKNLASIDDTNEYVLFLDKRSQEEISNIEKSLGISGKKNFCIVSLPAKNKFDWNLWVLPMYLRKHPVDVYHTQYITPFFVPSSIKIITHIHDVSFRVYPELIGWKDRLFLSLLIPMSLRRSDVIVAVSEFTKKEIEKYYVVRPEKIQVVLNALADDFLVEGNSSEIDKNSVREKYQLPKEYVLYIGTLQPRKNIPSLIQAFSLIQDKLPHMKLVIVGNKKGHHYDMRIDEAIQKYGALEKVVFPGFIDQKDLSVVIHMASMFVFPSLYEGFGIPVLEAMSQKIPVIASDIPVLREVGGDACVYVNTADIASFSQSMYNIATGQDVRNTLVKKGFERIHVFSWRKSAEKMRMIYEQL